jgi:hypothetical protein
VEDGVGFQVLEPATVGPHAVEPLRGPYPHRSIPRLRHRAYVVVGEAIAPLHEAAGDRVVSREADVRAADPYAIVTIDEERRQRTGRHRVISFGTDPGHDELDAIETGEPHGGRHPDEAARILRHRLDLAAGQAFVQAEAAELGGRNRRQGRVGRNGRDGGQKDRSHENPSREERVAHTLYSLFDPDHAIAPPHLPLECPACPADFES